MSPTDRPAFSALLNGCLNALYEKSVNPVLLEVWFNALAAYPLEEITAAFSRHITDPDRGQFPPKPADLIRAIDGGGDSRALGAWSKVDKAIRTVGGWRSVCFDDPLIHVCIAEMGGWLSLCTTATEKLPFRQQEFAKRYRALMLNPPAQYPARLIGRVEALNAPNGYPVEPPLLLGDPHRAAQVQMNGDGEGQPPSAVDPDRLVETTLRRLKAQTRAHPVERADA